MQIATKFHNHCQYVYDPTLIVMDERLNPKQLAHLYTVQTEVYGDIKKIVKIHNNRGYIDTVLVPARYCWEIETADDVIDFLERK